MKKKQVKVGCAIIFRGRSILLAQRRPGTHLSGYWEFPGGKWRAAETLQECLVREVWEELRVHVQPFCEYGFREHPYPDRVVQLYFYFCRYISGSPARMESCAWKWVDIEKLSHCRLPPADMDVVGDLRQTWRFHLYGVRLPA